MDKKIEELTKTMTKERQQIYKSVRVCLKHFISFLVFERFNFTYLNKNRIT